MTNRKTCLLDFSLVHVGLAGMASLLWLNHRPFKYRVSLPEIGGNMADTWFDWGTRQFLGFPWFFNIYLPIGKACREADSGRSPSISGLYLVTNWLSWSKVLCTFEMPEFEKFLLIHERRSFYQFEEVKIKIQKKFFFSQVTNQLLRQH